MIAVLSATALLLLLLLAAGVVVSSIFAWQVSDREQQIRGQLQTLRPQSEALKADRAKALQAAADSHAMPTFLVDDGLAAARPLDGGNALGIDVTLRDALAAAAERTDQRFRGQPEAEALDITPRRAKTDWELARKRLGRAGQAGPIDDFPVKAGIEAFCWT